MIPDTRALSVTRNQQEERSAKRAKTAEMESEASAILLRTPANATKDGRVLDAIRSERNATHSHRFTVEEAASPTRIAVTLDLINAILYTRVESVREASAFASMVTHCTTAGNPETVAKGDLVCNDGVSSGTLTVATLLSVLVFMAYHM